MVIFRPRSPKKQKEDVKVVLDGGDIVPEPSVKILRLTILADSKVTASLRKLKHSSEKIRHMLQRVETRRREMNENDTLRLVQAFVVPRITLVSRINLTSLMSKGEERYAWQLNKPSESP